LKSPKKISTRVKIAAGTAKYLGEGIEDSSSPIPVFFFCFLGDICEE
jgi:hypothetical protein